MKTRLLFVPLLLVLVASLAACGGGAASIPANAIAVVGGVPITTAKFNALFTQVEAQQVAQGQTKPTPGTPQYTALRNQVVAYLVQVAEVEQQAPKEKVSVTQAEVTKFINNVAKTNFKGDMAKLTAELKKQGLTMAAARDQVYITLLERKLHDSVSKSATVTPADEQKYYHDNISQYATPEQSTRSVEHILVKTKSLADRLEAQLKGGANFAALAKKYSQDPGSAAQGGKYTATKGREVAAYDNVAFALKTGELSPPVDSTSSANGGFGWFIIKALAPVQTTKAHTTSFKQAEPQIKSTLLQQKQDALWSQWLSDLTKQYAGKVSYQSGYAPPTTTALPTTTAVTTG